MSKNDKYVKCTIGTPNLWIDSSVPSKLGWLTTKELLVKYPMIKKGTLRDWRFRRKTNGMAESGCMFIIGHKLYFDEDKFIKWLEGRIKE